MAEQRECRDILTLVGLEVACKRWDVTKIIMKPSFTGFLQYCVRVATELCYTHVEATEYTNAGNFFSRLSINTNTTHLRCEHMVPILQDQSEHNNGGI